MATAHNGSISAPKAARAAGHNNRQSLQNNGLPQRDNQGGLQCVRVNAPGERLFIECLRLMLSTRKDKQINFKVVFTLSNLCTLSLALNGPKSLQNHRRLPSRESSRARLSHSMPTYRDRCCADRHGTECRTPPKQNVVRDCSMKETGGTTPSTEVIWWTSQYMVHRENTTLDILVPTRRVALI